MSPDPIGAGEPALMWTKLRGKVFAASIFPQAFSMENPLSGNTIL